MVPSERLDEVCGLAREVFPEATNVAPVLYDGEALAEVWTNDRAQVYRRSTLLALRAHAVA